MSLHRAVRSLLVPQVARVEMLHRRAVNLRLVSGEMVSLCAPELGNGPGVLLVAAEWPLPWQVGDRLLLQPGVISGPGTTMTLGGAMEWEPSPPPGLGPLALVRRGWRLAMESLGGSRSPFASLVRDALVTDQGGELQPAEATPCETQSQLAYSVQLCGVLGESCGVLGESCAIMASSGLHEQFWGVRGESWRLRGESWRLPGELSPIMAIHGVHGELRGKLAKSADSFLGLAQPALLALQSHDWTAAVARLVGLGPGLTPSGDDLLGGFLLLALRTGWAPAAPLAAVIRALPPGRTTPLSESLLHWATEGVASERALHWLDGLLRGAPPPIGPLLAIGATSGADWAAGALLALDLLLKEAGS